MLPVWRQLHSDKMHGGKSKYTIWLYLLRSARVCTTFAFVTKSSKQCPLRISTASPLQHKFGTSRPPFGFEGIAVVTETDPTVVIFSSESEKIKKIAVKNLLVLRKNINLKWWSNWWHRKPLIYSCLHVAACLIMKQILLFFITQSAHGYTTESLRQRSFFRSASIHFKWLNMFCSDYMGQVPNWSTLFSSSYFTFVFVLFLHDFQDSVQKFDTQALQHICPQVFYDSPYLGWTRFWTF